MGLFEGGLVFSSGVLGLALSDHPPPYTRSLPQADWVDWVSLSFSLLTLWAEEGVFVQPRPMGLRAFRVLVRSMEPLPGWESSPWSQAPTANTFRLVSP